MRFVAKYNLRGLGRGHAMSTTEAEITVPQQLPPSSRAKRMAIVQAAARVFLRFGYGAASMDQIASEAQVSKQTIYSHFGAKDALFEEIVRSKCAALMGEADATVPEKKNIRALLFETAVRFQRVVLADESITLFRMIVAESGRFPELAEAFYRSGPRHASDDLARALGDANGHSGMQIDDPVCAAEQFFSILRDDLYMRRLVGMSCMPDEKEIEQRAERAVSLFVNAHRS